jgi:glycosyltransferase domain-containing protein
MPLRVVIADSSRNSIKKQNEETVSLFDAFDIEYHDEYSVDTEPFLKYVALSCFSGTKYSVFLADDDFLSPYLLSDCIQYLQGHPETVSIRGDFYGIRDDTRNVYWKPIYHTRTLSGRDSVERVTNLIDSYRPTIYDVHRTHQLRQILTSIQDAAVNPLYFTELAFDILAASQGDMMHHPEFYMARSIDCKITFYPSLYTAMQNPVFKEDEYQRFTSLLINQIPGATRPFIDNLLGTYIQRNKHNSLYTRRAMLSKRLHIPILLDDRLRSFIQHNKPLQYRTPVDWAYEYRILKSTIIIYQKENKNL